MTLIQQKFQVPFTYNIYFSTDLFSVENNLLLYFLQNFGNINFNKKILFLIDNGVAEAHPNLVENITKYFKIANSNKIELTKIQIFQGGEQIKNSPETLAEILQLIDSEGIDRHSFVAAIGGGAFLDMAGYASAIAHRGVKHIRIPSTVLSQNDSGVGVKNGINFQHSLFK